MSAGDLVDELSALYVWPQSVADEHADTLTPRQIEKLYAVGNVAERAATLITDLRAQLAAAQAECEEQARIVGMGAEREAALMAKVAVFSAWMALVEGAIRVAVNSHTLECDCLLCAALERPDQ